MVRVPQYRNLQSRFLLSQSHNWQPCDLLMVQGVTPAHKGLAPSRKIRTLARMNAHAGHTQRIKLIASTSLFTKILADFLFGLYLLN